MDRIDQAVMKARLHHLGMASRYAEPVMHLVVLTCMDARIDVAALLGLRPGDAHVIRNAGGRATTDAINAIAISQAVLGTSEVMVMHHTQCAMSRFTQSELAARIAAATNHSFTEELGVIADEQQAVREDVGRLRLSRALVHRDKIRGFLYNLATDAVTEVAS